MSTLAAAAWRVQSYPSGTHVVTDLSPGPWLHVLACNTALGEGDVDRLKWSMCDDLARFLNGGPRPAWLDDMERCGPDALEGADGSRIEATGPMYDADPPNLNWRQRDDSAARDARAELIDRIW